MEYDSFFVGEERKRNYRKGMKLTKAYLRQFSSLIAALVAIVHGRVVHSRVVIDNVIMIMIIPGCVITVKIVIFCSFTFKMIGLAIVVIFNPFQIFFF